MFSIKRMFTTLILAIVMVLFGAGVAFAQEVTTSDVKYSSSAASATAMTAARVNSSSKIEVEHVSSVGVTKRPTASTCKLVSSWGKRPAGAKCFRLKRGAPYQTIVRNRDGKLEWLSTIVGASTSSSPDASWLMFVLRDGDGDGDKEWLKAGDEHGHGNCRNPARGPGKPTRLTWKITQEFKSFSYVQYKVGVDLYEAGKVTAYATATCNTSGSSATASAEAWLRIRIYVFVSAKTSVQAKLKGPGAISASQKTQIKLDVKADGLLDIKAQASAWCTDTPPAHEAPSISVNPGACVKEGQTTGIVTVVVTNPNPTASPADVTVGSTTKHVDSIAAGSSVTLTFPNFGSGTYGVTAVLTAFNKTASTQVTVAKCAPEAPPMFLQFREFNDLEVNWVDDHCVTVDFPAGHSGTVFWTAKYGSFATPQKTAQDSVQICSDYKAPSEVPGTGTDTITVTATDSVTGLKVTQTTDPFKIYPTASHPG